MTEKGFRPIAMTIAGSDSGGGAGIEADLRVFAAHGVFGTAAVTAITAQNTSGVQHVHHLSSTTVKQQIASVLDDMPVAAIKIGMLGNEDIVRAVAESIPHKSEIPVVVDPVMMAKNGEQLLEKDAIDCLLNVLLPKATLITPNIPEAELLLGFTIEDKDLEMKAAYELHKQTGAKVVLKGGHRKHERSDLFYDGKSFHWLHDNGIIVDQQVHGTGCALSASIIAHLALGMNVAEAVRDAKDYMNLIIGHVWYPGKGNAVLPHLLPLEREAQKGVVLESLDMAFQELRELPNVTSIVPQISTNIAFCLPQPKGYDDVAGFPGRITICDGRLYTAAGPRFGAVKHTARVILAANRADSRLRCIMPIRYDQQILDYFGRMGLSIGSFDRSEEPGEGHEGGTLEWGTANAFATAGDSLDVVYDEGAVGKEPIIRLLASDTRQMVHYVAALLELMG